MLKELLGISDLLAVPVFVMFFFITGFVGMLLLVFSRRRAPHYQAMAQLPLDGVAERVLSEGEEQG